jgi:hypothetical protein
MTTSRITSGEESNQRNGSSTEFFGQAIVIAYSPHLTRRCI